MTALLFVNNHWLQLFDALCFQGNEGAPGPAGQNAQRSIGVPGPKGLWRCTMCTKHRLTRRPCRTERSPAASLDSNLGSWRAKRVPTMSTIVFSPPGAPGQPLPGSVGPAGPPVTAMLGDFSAHTRCFRASLVLTVVPAHPVQTAR